MIKKLTLMAMLMALSTGAAAEMKIVVLDTVRAILESEEAKVLITAAEKEMEGEQNELRQLAEQHQGLQEKLSKDRDVMSQTEQRSVAKDIEDLEIDLQFRSQKLLLQTVDAEGSG